MLRHQAISPANRLRCALGAALLLAALPAIAALGQPATSIAADGSVLAQQPLQAASAGVSVVRVTTAEGVLVTEYVNQGVVFALSWSGAVMPSLQPLLADAFPTLRAWLGSHPLALNQPIAMDTPQLVVRAAGHMHAFNGLAYLPALVPPGFDLNQIGN